jgi:hypothetical protein
VGIQGKVATILNERDLVINRGSLSGVKEGMIFAILEPTVEITDPDSGNSLGSITREKIRVKIIEVEGQFSVGKTYETYRSSLYPASLLGVGLGATTKVRTLRTGNSGINLSSSGDEDSASVEIGDFVFKQERAE